MEVAMTQLSRRDFLRATAAGVGLGAASGSALAGCAAPVKGDLAKKSARRVVVIGGGWGGATAAKYVRLQDP
jgi:sulfide dehydrogenase [flavocytochrome c] flavoprotein subunit